MIIIFSAQEQLSNIIPNNVMDNFCTEKLASCIENAENLEEMSYHISNSLDEFFSENKEYMKDDVNKSLRLAIEW